MRHRSGQLTSLQALSGGRTPVNMEARRGRDHAAASVHRPRIRRMAVTDPPGLEGRRATSHRAASGQRLTLIARFVKGAVPSSALHTRVIAPRILKGEFDCPSSRLMSVKRAYGCRAVRALAIRGALVRIGTGLAPTQTSVGRRATQRQMESARLK